MHNNKPYNRLFKGLLAVLLIVMLLTRLFDNWLLPTLKSGLAAAGPFIWGFALAYLLRFAVHPLEKLLLKITKSKRTGWARAVATITALIVTVGVIGTLIAVLVPQVYRNVVALAGALPDYLSAVFDFVEQAADKLNIKLTAEGVSLWETVQEKLSALINDNAGKYAGMAGNLLMGIGSLLMQAFITIIVAFYLLIDGGRYKQLLKRGLSAATSSTKRYDGIIDFLHQADDVMGKFITGRLLQVLIIAVLACAGFWAVGLEYAALMGLLVGVLNIIPYIGPWIAAIPVLLLALLQNPATALYAAIIIIGLQLLDNLLLGPKILGETLKTSPLWIFVGIIIGGAMFGIPGMILGAPAIVLLGGLLQKFMEFREKQKAENKDTNSEANTNG